MVFWVGAGGPKCIINIMADHLGEGPCALVGNGDYVALLSCERSQFIVGNSVDFVGAVSFAREPSHVFTWEDFLSELGTICPVPHIDATGRLFVAYNKDRTYSNRRTIGVYSSKHGIGVVSDGTGAILEAIVDFMERLATGAGPDEVAGWIRNEKREGKCP
jgi:hypothetical protein